jgi:hypothetical protein
MSCELRHITSVIHLRGLKTTSSHVECELFKKMFHTNQAPVSQKSWGLVGEEKRKMNL